MIDIPFTTEDDLKKTIPIVKNELKKNNIEMDDEKLEKLTSDIMHISYAKGGWYSDGEIRAYTRDFIISMSCQIVIEELKKNNIQMPEKNAYNLTQVIMFSLHLTDRGYSKEEIIDMTKNYIATEKYREFISKE